MKKSLILSVVAALIIAAVWVGLLQAQNVPNQKKVIYAAAAHAKFDQTPTAGVTMATVWGDPDKGAHGTFTKFVPGFDSGMHTHTSELSLVVIKGAYLYKDDQGEKRVGPGDFIRIPAGHKHWSGGDKTEGALFYEEGPGKFDSIPTK